MTTGLRSKLPQTLLGLTGGLQMRGSASTRKVNGMHSDRVGGMRKPRKRKCKHCRAWFDPSRRHQVFCSERCQKNAWRLKKRKGGSVSKDCTALEPSVCLHCGSSYWATSGKGQKFCKPGCRTMASRVKRLATIQAFSQHTGKSLSEVHDLAELGGLKAMQAFLSKTGLVYESMSRCWLGPMELKQSA
jgi:predicted nucleic acid-binding Zn ribbon protein